MAEQRLAEVLGRIRDEHASIVLPPQTDGPGRDQPATLRQAVERHAVAAGADPATPERLLRKAVTRAFLAHDVAMALGSRACPLPEDLARGLWERTAPDAARWRVLGIFRNPLPVPDDASWGDRFLLSAGRDPHPFLD